MKTIYLDMNITADQAREEWEALPDSTPSYIRSAYFLRYNRRKAGSSQPVPYAVSDAPTASFKETPTKTTPRLAAKVAARKAEAPAKAQRKLPSKPIARNPRQNIGRASGINPADYPAIHARILQAARELGYGDLQSGGVNKVHGAAAAFTRNAAIPSSQSFNDTITSGRKIWPKVIDQIATGIGIEKQWLLTGEGDQYKPSVIRFTPRPTVTERRKQIIAAVAPALAAKYPPRKISDALVFNVTHTFSIYGPRAFTSAFAA